MGPQDAAFLQEAAEKHFSKVPNRKNVVKREKETEPWRESTQLGIQYEVAPLSELYQILLSWELPPTSNFVDDKSIE